jgi:hypothetical protein
MNGQRDLQPGRKTAGGNGRKAKIAMTRRIWFEVLAWGLPIAAGLGQSGVAQEVSPAEAREKAALAAETYIVFDVPGSSCPTGFIIPCAIPVGVDSQGTIAGTYLGPGLLNYSFYRLKDGTIGSSDVSEAVCQGEDVYGYGCTDVNAISPSGTIISRG